MADKQIVCSYCARKRCFVGDLSQAPKESGRLMLAKLRLKPTRFEENNNPLL